MKSKYILGSGLIGLMAYDILGESWDIIPQGPSRYYSWPIAPADNFLTLNGTTKTIITPDTKIFTKAYSYGGDLIFSNNQLAGNLYMAKVYGMANHFINIPMEQIISTQTCSELYKRLLEKHMDLIVGNNEKNGKIIQITDEFIITEKSKFEYDRIVSTIPLNALYKYCSQQIEFTSKDVWVYHIKTGSIDFEGADQVFVADPEIDFYKVNKIDRYNYLFFCLNQINNPNKFFETYIENEFHILNNIKCKSFIPIGTPISRVPFNNRITCIGSHAQWDDMADVGSCIVRILKI